MQTNRPPAPQPARHWEDLATREVADRWTEYLVLPDARGAARPTSRSGSSRSPPSAALPGEAARAVCALVNDEVEYLAGSTDVQRRPPRPGSSAPASARTWCTWRSAGCASLGIPARYVSGYFHPDARPGGRRDRRGESHAWVEWWDDGWHPFDPTNERGARRPVRGRRRRARLPRRQAAVSGIYSGAATSEMSVKVDVTRLA